jgi:transcriptional regulator with XRE-family HTH domain
MAGKHKPIPDDAFYRDLGRTIRLTRVAAGKSQTDAADHLDCSFQQIQKYESGINRIPVDCLVSLAAYLDVPVAHFMGTSSRSKEESAFLALLDKFEGKEFAALLEYWTAIKDKQVRTAFLSLAKSMANLKR